MEHLNALISTSPDAETATPSPTDCSRRLRATLSSVARSIKSNFVETLYKKRASSPTPDSTSPPSSSSKRRRLLVSPSDSTILIPSESSTVSSLTQPNDTNQAILDVLYGGSQEPKRKVRFTPTLLSTLNLGLRRLLVPDILQLQEEDKIVVVLSISSRLFPLYKGAILQHIRQNDRTLPQTSRLQLANELLQKRHEFQRLGKFLFEFRATVVSYPKRHLLYDNEIDRATLRLWLGQGEGLSVEFLDYPGQTTLVKWKDLQDTSSSLEIWRLATRDDALLPISFGRPRSMEAKCDDFSKSLSAVSGDITQTLNVLLEYYRSESSMYRRCASELIAHTTKATMLQTDSYLDELRNEIQSSALDLFLSKVDDLYKLAIAQHYNSFHFVNEPLLPSATKAMLYKALSDRFPMHCSVLDSVCTTDRNLHASNPPTFQKKQNVVLFHFLTLCRQRNKDSTQRHEIEWSDGPSIPSGRE
jgi:hypothetical protein